MKTIGTIFLERLLENNKYNLLFIIMFCLYSCHSVKYQQENLQYDSLTQTNVYIFVEKMPNYNGGEVAFMNDFSKKLQYTFSESGEIKTRLQVQFVIDVKGHLIGARIYNKAIDELTTFEKAVLKALNLMQDWHVGRHNNKLVNVLITKTIHIDLNN